MPLSLCFWSGRGPTALAQPQRQTWSQEHKRKARQHSRNEMYTWGLTGARTGLGQQGQALIVAPPGPGPFSEKVAEQCGCSLSESWFPRPMVRFIFNCKKPFMYFPSLSFFSNRKKPTIYKKSDLDMKTTNGSLLSEYKNHKIVDAPHFCSNQKHQ